MTLLYYKTVQASDHLKTGPMVRFLNGLDAQFLLKWTIQIPDLSGFRIPTVLDVNKVERCKTRGNKRTRAHFSLSKIKIELIHNSSSKHLLLRIFFKSRKNLYLDHQIT